MVKSIAKKKKRSVKKLSAAERKARKYKADHKALVRSVLRSTGFNRYPKLADKEFSIDETTKSDFDDIYVFENLIVLVEYTTAKDVGGHLKPKKIVYDKIEANPKGFVDILRNLDGEFASDINKSYTPDELHLKILYCSRKSYDSKYKLEVPNPVFLDYPELRYFKLITDSIKRSALHEFLHFLGISHEQIGVNGQIGTSTSNQAYPGSLLPEANSNFDPGFKVVSFYVDPEALLRRSYVLRKEGWRNAGNVYQRMISKGKIQAIRKHLKENKRVFVNNIIATLPDDTQIVGTSGKTIDPKKIIKTTPAIIQIPDRMNTVGLIDGQHRLYSYHSTKPEDIEITKLRRKQNLLITGIIYPQGLSQPEREKFEARLFLEINANQTNAKSNLKQAINLILKPFSDESIAKRILDELGKTGALSGHVEKYWFDNNKLKTTSVVSYALKPLVKTNGADSLFALWDEPSKKDMVEKEDSTLLKKYVKFCVTEINLLLGAVESVIPKDQWTPDKNIQGRFITTTNINSILICMRLLIENDKIGDFSFYKKNLTDFSIKSLGDFHSSQYGRMAERIYTKYFSD
ncbi:MAG: DGQHR domain-containing protein [Robiginitomaculum sp.]|nr:DGQHR domain-containing protein [Robiginitomaculum sp.]